MAATRGSKRSLPQTPEEEQVESSTSTKRRRRNPSSPQSNIRVTIDEQDTEIKSLNAENERLRGLVYTLQENHKPYFVEDATLLSDLRKILCRIEKWTSGWALDGVLMDTLGREDLASVELLLYGGQNIHVPALATSSGASRVFRIDRGAVVLVEAVLFCFVLENVVTKPLHFLSFHERFRQQGHELMKAFASMKDVITEGPFGDGQYWLSQTVRALYQPNQYDVSKSMFIEHDRFENARSIRHTGLHKSIMSSAFCHLLKKVNATQEAERDVELKRIFRVAEKASLRLGAQDAHVTLHYSKDGDMLQKYRCDEPSSMPHRMMCIKQDDPDLDGHAVDLIYSPAVILAEYPPDTSVKVQRILHKSVQLVLRLSDLRTRRTYKSFYSKKQLQEKISSHVQSKMDSDDPAVEALRHTKDDTTYDSTSKLRQPADAETLGLKHKVEVLTQKVDVIERHVGIEIAKQEDADEDGEEDKEESEEQQPQSAALLSPPPKLSNPLAANMLADEHNVGLANADTQSVGKALQKESDSRVVENGSQSEPEVLSVQHNAQGPPLEVGNTPNYISSADANATPPDTRSKDHKDSPAETSIAIDLTTEDDDTVGKQPANPELSRKVRSTFSNSEESPRADEVVELHQQNRPELLQATTAQVGANEEEAEHRLSPSLSFEGSLSTQGYFKEPPKVDDMTPKRCHIRPKSDCPTCTSFSLGATKLGAFRPLRN